VRFLSSRSESEGGFVPGGEPAGQIAEAEGDIPF
jgi:hypothetical protein